MNTPLQSHQVEREALGRLLASGVFSRSPNLEKIVVYLCSKYFEGGSNLIKEYHVATEALGRSEDFDPKKDSIVRVEMHRLRKRLREYYESAGDEPVWILIPEKPYNPEFRPRGNQGGVASEPVVTDAIAAAPVSRRRWLAAAAAVGLPAAGTALWLGTRKAAAPAEEPAKTVNASVDPVSPTSNTDTIRIMAGHGPARFTDRFGSVWEGDRYFTGGTARPVTNEVASRGFDVNLFTNMRDGDFQYDIPLKPGVYELLLLFAETEYGEKNPLGGGETSRVFSISANGKVLVTDFEALAETLETNTATARLLRDLSPAADGKLHLKFGPASTGRPFLNAMLIRPGTPGKLRPIRIVCRPQTHRDSRGSVWEPDHFFRSGMQITRPQGAPADDGDVLRGERYGNFSYIIPVPPGRYGARLYFWEYWWGEGHPGKGGPGSRIFDVMCNYKPLLIDFDIVRENPKDQVTVKTFHGLTPNAQGKLMFDFVSKINYAMVNAIEIFDESA